MFISDPRRLCPVVYLCSVSVLLVCTRIPCHKQLLRIYKLLLRFRKWGLIFSLLTKQQTIFINAAIIYSYKLRTNGSTVSTLNKHYSKIAQVTCNKPVQLSM